VEAELEEAGSEDEDKMEGSEGATAAATEEELALGEEFKIELEGPDDE
jgi:hypothetical protein